MTWEERNVMIVTLAWMTGFSESAFAGLTDEQLRERYERELKTRQGGR